MNMNSISRVVTAGLLSAGLIAFTPMAKADEWDKRTTVTFHEPVEIPGMVLPPGTYVMRLLDSPSDRDIVEFFNQNQTFLYDTVLAIPEYRERPTDRTVITFEERTTGSPQAIRTWFYPGDLRGEEFLYPKVHPAVITAQSTPPPSRTAAPAPQSQPKVQPGPAPALKPTESANSPNMAKPAETGKAAPAPASTVPPESQPAKELPKTSSELPLIVLLGSLAVVAGSVLRCLSAARM